MHSSCQLNEMNPLSAAGTLHLGVRTDISHDSRNFGLQNSIFTQIHLLCDLWNATPLHFDRRNNVFLLYQDSERA